MKVLQHCFVPVGALLLSGCGWVDSSGRQDNRAPGLAELTQTVSEEAVHVNLGVADEDNNLINADVSLLTTGGALSAACVEAGGALSGVAIDDFAQTLEEACDPAEQSCEIVVDAELTASKIEVSTPKMRRPVALQYTLSLEDSDGATAEQVLTLCIASVSSAPDGQNDVFNVEYNETTVFMGMEFDADCGPQVASGVLANDTDDFDFSEDEPNLQRCLIAQLVTAPVHASAFTLDEDGGFSYSSGTSLAIGASDSFSYSAWDGVNASDAATVTLHVTGENDPPVALNPTRNIDEDTVLVLSATDLASDSEGGELTLVSVGLPTASPALGLRAFDVSPAEIRYTPFANASGSDSFSYLISDAGGATATGTVSITVDPVNDLPVVTPTNSTLALGVSPATDTQYFTVSDQENTLAGLSISVSSSDELALTVVESQSGGDGDADNWQVDFTGLADGVSTVTLAVEDADGGISNAVIAVTVGSGVANTAPVLGSPALVAIEGLPASWTISGDALASDGESLASTLIISGAVSVSSGETVTVDGDNKGFSFVPVGTGAKLVSLTVQDPGGLQVSGDLTVTVSAQQPPVIVDPVLTATVGVSKSLSLSGDALATDADTAVTSLVIVGTPVTVPAETVTVVGGDSFTFTPTAAGTVTITLTVADPQGNQDTGSITVLVSAATQSPVIENPALSGVAGVLVALNLSADGLASDADSNVTDLVVVGTPSVDTSETVTVDGDSKGFSFIPSADGSSVVTLTVQDPEGNSVTGALTVVVSEASPVIESPALVATVGVAVVFSIDGSGLASDADTLTTDLTFTAAPTVDTLETVTLVDSKSFSFTPAAAGTSIISLSVTDPDGNAVAGTVSVTVGI